MLKSCFRNNGFKIMKFTLYWRNGQREELEGADICNALFKAGRPTHTLAQLAFYIRGEDHDFTFNMNNKTWVRREPIIQG